jgi:CxxC-x17-CxxC domain-containing protein
VSFQNKSIQCADCGTTFTFSAEDQEFFRSKGYTNQPKRCPECRQARKAERYDDGGNSYKNSTSGYIPGRQMHPAVCADCGRATSVPFEPRQGRPVYCGDCYRKVRAGR